MKGSSHEACSWLQKVAGIMDTEDQKKKAISQKTQKIIRVLSIYTRLVRGEVIHKRAEAVNYGVAERSIQRDIDDIRAFLAEECAANGELNQAVIYDMQRQGYVLKKNCCSIEEYTRI